MPLHADPICFGCEEPITRGQDPLFAAPCDHDACPSVVFHPLCLMEHREHWALMMQRRARFAEHHRVNVTVEVEHLHDD